MRAIRFDRYGGPEVLEVRDVPTPEIGDRDVLVRVSAAAINPADWHVMTGLPYLFRAQLGLRRPKVPGLGSDLAGTIEAVGTAVTRFRKGDEVYGRTDQLRGSKDLPELGALAEYVKVSEDSIRHLPGRLSVEQAAGVALAGTTALWAMRDSVDVQPGQRVLVNGASGGVGTYAVQIAKALGAEVVGVCSTRNVELVQSLGADHVVDYTRDDVTEARERYDLVLDNVGNHPAKAWRRVLAPGGTYLASFDHPGNRTFGPFGFILRMAAESRLTRQRMTILRPQRRDEDLDALTELIESGAVTPVVDRTFALAETRQAFEYLATRRARGKVVITL